MNMPWDVCTHWNLTFDMLDYAVVHREAIDTVTQRRDLGLRKFELVDSDWEIVSQLQDVLKVVVGHLLHWKLLTKHNIQDSQGHNFIFLLGDAEPCKGYSRNGFD